MNTAPPAPPRHVRAVGPHIFVSPNSLAFPILPLPNISKTEMYNDPLPHEGSAFRWSLDGYPQLPYCLKHPRYQGALLERLAFTFRSLPIDFDRGRYELSQNVQTLWHSLENCLIAATWELFRAANVMHHLSFQPFRYPSEYGYRRTYINKKQTRRLALMARDAFVPLMAMCSYAISLTPDFNTDNPSWVAKLEEVGIHPEWVEQLRTSQLADFSDTNERVGVIIQPNCVWLNRIPKMIKAGVPLWFLWDQPGDFTNTLVAKYRPTLAEVQAARRTGSWQEVPRVLASVSDDSTTLPDDSTFVPDDSSLVPDTPSQPSATSQERFPKPDPLSGQKRGETMDQFFDRRAARHALMEKSESPAERRSRLDRARAAEQHRCPGRAGPRCFTWEDVDGCLMRTHLVRAAVEDDWVNYTNSQRKYDSFYNEWDLATAFDPGASVDDDDDDDDPDDFSFRPDTPPPPPPYPPSSPPPPPHEIFSQDISAVYRNDASGDETHNEASEMNIPDPESIEDILYYRYGYNWDGMTHYNASRSIPMALTPWINIQKTMMDIKSNVDVNNQFTITNFVDFLVQDKTIPSALWDLNDYNPSPLRGHFNPHLVVTYRTFDKNTFFFIQSAGAPSSNDPPWYLAVQDPATALECYRRDVGPSVIDVAKLFLAAGKPFTTRIHSSHPPPIRPLRRRDPVGLGWRNVGYRGDSGDYAGYENRRKAFLVQPRGRAGALAGGIVWRLVIHDLELSHICAGPSDDVFEYGDMICSDSSGVELWDDALSEDELNLICGVYRVRTKFSNQASDSSWWPKHSIWMASNMNVGYWSVGCETWFQMRLDAIRKGTAQLRTAAEWKDALRFWRSTKPFVANYNRTAAAFLHGQTIG
jgi:hypothetical protein